MANNVLRSFRLVFFYLALGVNSVFSVDFMLDFQFGIAFLTEELNSYSNNVRQYENRIVTDRSDLFGGGFELTTTFLINDHFSIGPGFAFYRTFSDFGQTNLATSTNYTISFFPIWLQAEYYIYPKTQKFNISFLAKVGGSIQLTESFRLENGQINPTNAVSFGGVIVIPSVKIMYGIWTYSHIYIEFQYPLIIGSYLRHFAYLGVGLKYRFRYTKPKEKSLINLPDINFNENEQINELKDNFNQ